MAIMIKSVTISILCLFVVTFSGHGQIAMIGSAQWDGEGPLSYVNENAPKGGRFTMGHVGSFNSLNPFQIRGQSPYELRVYVHESLGTRSWDEPFSIYGQLASDISLSDDRSSITFTIDPNARFADGQQVTAKDVLFSFELLRDHGRPNHRSYYSKVVKAQSDNDASITFDLPKDNRELALIMALMPVLPAHATDRQAFIDGKLERIMGSGPYQVASADFGRQLVLKRRDDYWGQQKNINKGRFNFDEIIIDYYRDSNALFESFKAGLIDVYIDSDPLHWQQAYQFPAANEGQIVQREFSHGRPSGLEGMVLNSRIPPLDKWQVRRGLNLLFPADEIGEAFFGGQRKHIDGYFSNTDLAMEASQVMANCMNKDPSFVPEKDMAEFTDPRRAKRKAFGLFQQAGLALKDGRWRLPDGSVFRLEIMAKDAASERILVTYANALTQSGIDASVRLVDSSQFTDRMQGFSYDATIWRWYVSLSPGNEQAYYWGSEAADNEGSRNYAGLKSSCVDDAIARLVDATNEDMFTIAMQDLMVGLKRSQMVVPFFYDDRDRVALNAGIGTPERTSLYGIQMDSWWRDQ
ncbi:MAG: ABC transporter substrate-binding protein [Alphaproteobacteria bacterium TMED150]|nr:ABC transporter substrate-binding protein [Paracoccaceae bacterium]RPH14298.1 MAG: ABC transporter substrate-binding protein [Alphaproteobacteria bacterium TMED150]